MVIQGKKKSTKGEDFVSKGKQALAQGEYDFAIQYFRQLIKENPSREDYRHLLGRAELEKAKSQVNFLTRPLFTLWAFILVSIFRLHGAGFNVAKVLAKSNPGSKSAVKLYGTCCEKTGNLEEAIQTYEVFLREQPFDKDILRRLSKIYYDREDYQNAVRTLRALHKMVPEDIEVSKMFDVATTQKYASEGTDVRKNQRIEEERRKFEARQQKMDPRKVNNLIAKCQENPEEASLRVELVHELLKGQQYDQALGVLEGARDLQPTNEMILEELAQVYDQVGRPQDADSVLETLSQLRPDDQELKKRILDRRISRGKKAEETAEEAPPAEAPSEEELEQLRQQRLDLEIKEYRQKIKDNPANPDFNLKMGELLRQKGDISEAITFFQQAARKPTRAFKASKNLGECFYEKGMYDLAIDQMIKARDKAPSRHDFLSRDLKEIYYTMSEIYEAMGDLDNAIEALRPVYEEDITYRDVQQRFEGLYQRRKEQQ